MESDEKQWDVFISHASEDKEGFVRPLAASLRSLGVSVWYDEFSLTPGDSLSRSIDKGLSESRYGLVIISRHFIVKPWPEYELRGLVSREIEEDKVIIPVWLGVSRSEVIHFSPPLADKIAIPATGINAEDVSVQVLRVVRPDIYNSCPRAELHKMANGEAVAELQSELERAREQLHETEDQLSEYQCPLCGAGLSVRIDAPADPEEKHWDIREIFECGHQRFGGYTERPCPSDPRFPAFEDYELNFHENPEEPDLKWQCYALPNTKMAKLLSLPIGYGKTKEEAKKTVYERYSAYARKYVAR